MDCLLSPKAVKELQELLYIYIKNIYIYINPSFKNQVVSMKHKNVTPQLISLVKRWCWLAIKQRLFIKNERKGCDFHSLPGKLLASLFLKKASACHLPNVPCVMTASCFVFCLGRHYKASFAPENCLEWCNCTAYCTWHSGHSHWCGQKP